MQFAESMPQRELPRYRSYKTVWALKIADIQQSPADELSTVDGGTWRLIPVNPGYGHITVPHSYVQKHQPHVGGYYVEYIDGYQSFSPAKAFEEGYTAIDNDAPAVAMSQAETSGLVVSDAKSAADRGNPVPLETAIKGAGADRAPRVTPADIEAEITSEHYFTAAEGVHGAHDVEHRYYGSEIATTGNLMGEGAANPRQELHMLTFCVLVLRNGFTVTGQSACASPENFNAEIGRRIAREDAVRQVWPLMGYELRSSLARGIGGTQTCDIR